MSSDQQLRVPHQWDPRPQLTADQVALEVAATASKVAGLVHLFKGDVNEPVRSWLLAPVGELDGLSESVKSGAVTPVAEVPEPVREIGARTRDGIRRLFKNRGPV